MNRTYQVTVFLSEWVYIYHNLNVDTAAELMIGSTYAGYTVKVRQYER